MTRLLFVAGCLAACLATSTSAQAPATPAPQRPGTPFRAGIEVVSLNVTVMDGTNRYITDLDQGDFSVFEDGVKQELTFFNRRQQPDAVGIHQVEQHMRIDAQV